MKDFVAEAMFDGGNVQSFDLRKAIVRGLIIEVNHQSRKFVSSWINHGLIMDEVVWREATTSTRAGRGQWEIIAVLIGQGLRSRVQNDIDVLGC